MPDGWRDGSVRELNGNKRRRDGGLRLSKEVADRTLVRCRRFDCAGQQCRQFVGVLAVLGRVVLVARVRTMTVKVMRDKRVQALP